MKKVLLLVLGCLLACSLVACETNSNESVTTAAGAPGASVEIDLTKLSSTMVYSEVYNMMVSPDQYIGKIIRMRGQFALYEDSQSNKSYFACIIADATSCCSQGLEFVLESPPVDPQNYPTIGDEITVTGEFSTYEENGSRYCHLIKARFD